MAPTVDNRLVVSLALLVAGVGALDSAIGRVWDLFAVFAALVCLLALLGLRISGARQSVPIRRDLVLWLRRRAEAGSEPLEAVADRAVAAFRAGFVGASEGTSSPERRDADDAGPSPAHRDRERRP